MNIGLSGLIFSALLLFGNSMLIAKLVKTPGSHFWVFIATVAIQLGVISTITSFFYQLTPTGWLATQLLLIVITILLLRYGSSLNLSLRQSILANSRKWLFNIWPLPPTTLILGGVVLIPLILSAITQYLVPLSHPSYGDERMYHASRVLYWLQNQSVFPYTTHNDRQTVFTFGGELTFLWPLLFTRTEWVGRMVFWLGYPLAAIGLYLLLRALKVGRNLSLIGVLIFITTPIVMNHSVGLKPELWLTFFGLGTAYWLVQAGIQPDHKSESLFLSSLFLMLSINVKSTALALVLPVFVLPWFINHKPGQSRFKPVLVGSMIGLLLSGLIVTFGFNLVDYGHILGPATMRQVHTSDLSLLQLYTHAIRLPFLLLELPTVPSIGLRNSLTAFGNHLIALLGADKPLPLETSEGWPGLYLYTLPEQATKFSLGGIVWLVLLIIGGIGLSRNVLKTYPHIKLTPLSILVILDLFLLCSITFLIRWMPHSGLPERFLITPYALGLVISLILLKEFISVSRSLKIISFILVIWTVSIPVYSQSLSLESEISAPLSIMQFEWPFAKPLTYIPASAHILFVGAQNAPDYPLFAPQEDYNRQVISWGKTPFNGTRLEQLIKTHQITQVLIQNDQSLDFHWAPPITTTEFITWLTQNPDFSEVVLATKRMRLFETKAIKAIRQQEIEQGVQIFQAPPQAPLIMVNPSLRGQVGVDPTLKTALPIENLGESEQGYVRLKSGKNEGIEGRLWSKKSLPVILRFEVSASPNQDNFTYTTQLAGLVNGQFMTAQQIFTGTASLIFTVPLQSGYNDFSFSILNQSEATQPRNIDRQPIVGLHQILVEPLP